MRPSPVETSDLLVATTRSSVPTAPSVHTSPHPSVHHYLSTFISPAIKHRLLYHDRDPLLQNNKSWRYVQMENRSAPEVRLLESVFGRDVLIFLAPLVLALRAGLQ